MLQGAACDFNTSRYEVVRAQTALGSFPMVVWKDDDRVSHDIKRDGFWEWASPQEMLDLSPSRVRLRSKGKGKSKSRLNASVLLPGSLMLDIGAHIGYFSFLFSQYGHRVLAFEPMSGNRAAFNATCCLNPGLCDRIKIVPHALGNEQEKCIVHSSANNVGNGKLVCSNRLVGTCAKNPLCEKASARSLESCLDVQGSAQRADIVKIDVEGQECAALRSAERVFTTHRPRFFQVESNSAKSTRCVKAMATKLNYTAAAGIMAQSPDHVLFLTRQERQL